MSESEIYREMMRDPKCRKLYLRASELAHSQQARKRNKEFRNIMKSLRRKGYHVLLSNKGYRGIERTNYFKSGTCNFQYLPRKVPESVEKKETSPAREHITYEFLPSARNTHLVSNLGICPVLDLKDSCPQEILIYRPKDITDEMGGRTQLVEAILNQSPYFRNYTQKGLRKTKKTSDFERI